MRRASIHPFKMNGTAVILDVNSGSVHAVDDLILAVLDVYVPPQPGADPSADSGVNRAGLAVAALAGTYAEADVVEAVAELDELVARGWLFSSDNGLDSYQPVAGEPLRAICLNVAHACNLRCQYCFAGKGSYNGPAGLMSAEVARQAVDLLIRLSGGRPRCELDFFGGEPLLNWPVVLETIAYAREAGRKAGKAFSFTLTTNGMLLTPEIQEVLDQEEISVILSLDGRDQVNDTMRPAADGKGTYDRVAPAIQEFVRRRAASGTKAYATVRGTITAHNLDFAADALHMVDDLGLLSISLEPVVAKPEEHYALRPEHIPHMMGEYERLAAEYLKRQQEGRPFSFHHFILDLDRGPCLPRRLQGCGAGFQYLAVTPEGELYPCHQFVGRREYVLGTVTDGIQNEGLKETFLNCHIFTKSECPDCWARYYCSGGCHANAELVNGDLFHPDPAGCALEKKRIESALWVKVQQSLGSGVDLF